MHLRSIVLTIAATVALLASGCEKRVDDQERLIERGDQFGEFNFSGYAIDGVTGRAITNYELELVFGTTTKSARVDRDTSRFTVGGLPEARDYTVRISADGYRPFESINAAIDYDTEDEEFADGRKGFIFVAYLYPTSLTAPDTTINVFFGDSIAPVPNGTVRLTPAAVSSSLETDFAPIGGQVWQNTLDRLTGAQSVQIANGVASFPGANLVYGVQYDISVFGVAGYQADLNETITVGNVTAYDMTLVSSADPVLVRQYDSRDIYRGQVPASTPISLTYVFNRAIELSPTQAQGAAVNSLDLNSNFTLNDADGDAAVITPCMSVGDLDAECGWTITVSGNTLTLSGVRASDIQTDDPGDRVTSVTFGGFGGITIRPVGATSTSQDRTLQQLNPMMATSVTVALAQN